MKKLIIGLILLTSLLFRIVNIQNNPPSLTWDEVSWGYNAYSLGIDGKDEFGRFLPLDYLESFGDFKPPMYAYLTIFPVKFFGLNEFAIRFPSAIFGVFTVLFTYLLTKEIFNFSKDKEIHGFMAASVLAISPWHINLSRAAFEANVATFFIVIGVYTFLLAVRRNMWVLVISAIMFSLSMHTFNTARIVSPLLVIALVIGNYRELIKHKKQVLISVLVGSFIIMPAVPFLFSPQAKLRFNEVNIFTNIDVIKRVNEQIVLDGNTWWSKVIHNRRLAYGVEFINHYLDNLSPHFLFIKGDGNPKFSTQDVGQMYLWEMPFLIAGVLLLFKKKEGKWWVIPCWLLLGIIPAATARETPHALRIEASLPTFQIITAYGFLHILKMFISMKSNMLNLGSKFLIICVVILIVFLNSFYYLYNYHTFYPTEFSGEWQYGYKNAVQFAQDKYTDYDRIFVTEGLGRPYIYFLFYTKYNPTQFRDDSLITREALGFVHVERFGKYHFAKDLSLIPKKDEEKVLYIDVPGKIPEGAKVVKSFYLLNGKPSLVAYTL